MAELKSYFKSIDGRALVFTKNENQIEMLKSLFKSLVIVNPSKEGFRISTAKYRPVNLDCSLQRNIDECIRVFKPEVVLFDDDYKNKDLIQAAAEKSKLKYGCDFNASPYNQIDDSSSYKVEVVSAIRSLGYLNLKPGNILKIRAKVNYRETHGPKRRKAVLLLDFYDVDGKVIKTVDGIGKSSIFERNFRYLSDTNGDCVRLVEFIVPSNICRVELFTSGLGLQSEHVIDAEISVSLHDRNEKKRRSLQQQNDEGLPTPVIHDPRHKRYVHELTIASILDEFTHECLSHECKLLPLTQLDWERQLEDEAVDFLLVESCWKGNDDEWGTLTKGSGGRRKLQPLLQYCKQKNIPTVFWNKEDPPHYEKFGSIAAIFDLAITTDINMVDRYKRDFGIDVYPLSFGAQPKIHNPQLTIPRVNRAVFAGSYYGDKPERCADFNEVMSELDRAEVDYDIFDRNYGKDIDKFAFPEKYRRHIIGNLAPHDVWKAHKGFKYQVNMNSVQDSSTMFARRVYESLASGTPIISNDSVGVREHFGDIAIMSNKQNTIADQLRALQASPKEYHELAKRGVRAVMRDHTYGHRIQALCRLLNIDVELSLPKVTLAVEASDEFQIKRAQQLFDAQTAQNKHLFIALENFDTAYKFLNESTKNMTFAMKLAKDFYEDEARFYGNSKVLKHDVDSDLHCESLEDFMYWGEV